MCKFSLKEIRITTIYICRQILFSNLLRFRFTVVSFGFTSRIVFYFHSTEHLLGHLGERNLFLHGSISFSTGNIVFFSFTFWNCALNSFLTHQFIFEYHWFYQGEKNLNEGFLFSQNSLFILEWPIIHGFYPYCVE